MKDIFTIQKVDNGIILKTDDYIEYAMNQELSSEVKIELNITQINTES
nr:MAG TPA: hypothetical protein [Caudoviricetes sp.]